MVDCSPLFRTGVEAGLADCRADGMDPMVFESIRTQETQDVYYARGRTVIPPKSPVTWAKYAMDAWHFYGLAVDIVSTKYLWNPPEGEAWFVRMANHMLNHGLEWGGHWKRRDTPHIQWGKCAPSPSQLSKDAYHRGGRSAVWTLVKAA